MFFNLPFGSIFKIDVLMPCKISKNPTATNGFKKNAINQLMTAF